DIFGKVAGVVEVVVVAIQAVGDAAESAQPLQRLYDTGLNHVARAVQFCLRGTFSAELSQFVVNGFLEVFGLNPRLGGCLDLEDRTEQQALVFYVDILSNLLVVNQGLIQAAGFAAAKQLRQEIGLGIARLIDRRRDPSHVDARQLDLIGNHRSAFGSNGRRDSGDLGNG